MDIKFLARNKFIQNEKVQRGEGAEERKKY